MRNDSYLERIGCAPTEFNIPIYSSKNPAAAVRLYNNFLDATERLRDFPRLASLEPILDSEPEAFRSLVVAHHYKVIYYFDNETVYIIDLWDCRQSPSRLRKLLNKEKK